MTRHPSNGELKHHSCPVVIESIYLALIAMDVFFPFLFFLLFERGIVFQILESSLSM
jgi:hypothetical protein